MEIFHCATLSSPHEKQHEDNNDDGENEDNSLEEFPLWSGPCGSEDAPSKLNQCKKVLAAWAIGAGPFIYPKVIETAHTVLDLLTSYYRNKSNYN